MTTTNSSKAAGIESKKYNIDNYKEYWKNTELVPSSRPDTQLPFLIKTLKEEIDINKIETVLDVGVGYGRVAKAILEEFPEIIEYSGIDISEFAIKQSVNNLRKYWAYEGQDKQDIYTWYTQDFETYELGSLYDLVISVETMSVVPDWGTVCNWMDKMVSLSKKYIVNLEYINTTNQINNIGHDYKLYYDHHSKVDRCKPFRFTKDEYLFVTRVN